ncbi:hypothetical protein FHR24_001374 [Wenyingzhuangia heitensis]|uniref:DUF2892 domain-containing protein n=1 Tax=Wenyingzhuangia heitensis TaxID=1487859 RepID=A0ABX0UAT7_9FLAO|nr:DUF2892 domain-containing protein [Wenyingzhuangia heitensis]NIJ44935.1 hypothetical protein [Wenyingzhuangia heitensis]
MFHKYLKLVIAALVTVLAVLQFIDENIGNGILLLLLAGIFVFLYFKNEILLLAFLQMRKQNLEGTEKWLNKIKKPEMALITSQQAYFYYLQGLMVVQRNMTQGEKLLKKALGLGLRMGHDVAMAKLNLAGIAMSKRRKREATTLLNEAKKLDKHGMLADQIKLMKDQMKKI